MTPVILGEGTFGGDWAKPRSKFCNMLRRVGFDPIRFEGWNKNVDGLPSWLNWWQKGQHKSWEAGGFAFADFVRVLRLMNPGIRIRVIGHSHFVNVVIYACIRAERRGHPIYIDELVTVCSPVRSDMQHQANGARKYIGRWRQIASVDGDVMQFAGELFDGHWQVTGRTREWKQANDNKQLPSIGHSKLLNDPSHLREAELWIARFFTAEEATGV